MGVTFSWSINAPITNAVTGVLSGVEHVFMAEDKSLERVNNGLFVEQTNIDTNVEMAGEMFENWSFDTAQPLSLAHLKEMVRRELPASVYRCKGIIYTSDDPGKRFSLQIVGCRTEISVLDDWWSRFHVPKSSRLGLPEKSTQVD